MFGTRPWARRYEDDPVTKHLLSRKVIIPYHEDLHAAANGFLDPPFKQSLGQTNTELLGMHHYTVHIKLGIAREYVDELQAKLTSNTFSLAIDPSFTFHKLLSGFFTNLMACYDNLAQELRLLFTRWLDDKANMFDVLAAVKEMNDKVQAGTALSHEQRIAALFAIFHNAKPRIEVMMRYRNYLTHRKIMSSMAAVSASAPAMPLKWHKLHGMIPPGASSFPLPSGSFASVMGSGIANTSGQQIMVSILQATTIHPARFFLPKSEKLDVLPTQLNYLNDLDERPITDICEEFYTWTVEFLGKTYDAMVRDFQILP
jgi:hypothetical protein